MHSGNWLACDFGPAGTPELTMPAMKSPRREPQLRRREQRAAASHSSQTAPAAPKMSLPKVPWHALRSGQIFHMVLLSQV